MDDSPTFRAALEEKKRSSIGHLLIRCARLFNEEGLKRVRRDPALWAAKASHLSLFPHLDLDGTRLNELARRMDVTKQAVGQLVDELEDMGLLERRGDPLDRRAKLVTFTDRGRTVMLRGLEVIAEIEAQLLAQLSSRRREDLRGSLENMMATLEGMRDLGSLSPEGEPRNAKDGKGG